MLGPVLGPGLGPAVTGGVSPSMTSSTSNDADSGPSLALLPATDEAGNRKPMSSEVLAPTARPTSPTAVRSTAASGRSGDSPAAERPDQSSVTSSNSPDGEAGSERRTSMIHARSLPADGPALVTDRVRTARSPGLTTGSPTKLTVVVAYGWPSHDTLTVSPAHCVRR